MYKTLVLICIALLFGACTNKNTDSLNTGSTNVDSSSERNDPVTEPSRIVEESDINSLIE